MNEPKKILSYIFSPPLPLTEEHIKSIPNKLFGVFIIYKDEATMPEHALTVDSGTLSEALREFLSTHRHVTYWFAHHACRREHARKIKEEISKEINLARRR